MHNASWRPRDPRLVAGPPGGTDLRQWPQSAQHDSSQQNQPQAPGTLGTKADGKSPINPVAFFVCWLV